MRIALFLALALAAAAPAAAVNQVQAQGLTEEALNLYRRGDFASALSSVNKAVTADPRYLPAIALRAHLQHAFGDREAAAKDLERAVRMPSLRRPDVLTLRGGARLLAGDLRKAEEDFRVAIKLNYEYADAYHGLGRAAAARGDLQAAMRQWKEALKHDPNLALARYRLGEALHESGRTDEAVKELTRALQVNPRFPLPYSLLGAIFAGRGDTGRALKAYSKAIFLMPQLRHPYMGRALVYLKKGSEKLAFKDFDQAIAAGKTDYAPLYNRGEVLHRLGRRDEALADFEKALALPVPDPEPALAMAARFLEARRWEPAAAMLTKALKVLSEWEDADERRTLGEEAFLRRARALEALGQDELAAKDLDAAVALSSASAAAWTARGRLRAKAGRPREALRDLNHALALSERHAPALLARGNLKALFGSYKEALADLTAAVSAGASPPSGPARSARLDLADARRVLADARNNRGILLADRFRRYGPAVEDLEEALKIEPENPGFHLNLGMARVQALELWKAVEALDRALTLKAPAAGTLRRRAEAYFALGDLAKAYEDLEQALRLAPRSADIYAAAGALRVRARSYERAIEDLDRALALDRRHEAALRSRGLAYAGLGDYARAGRDFRAAARLGDRPAEGLTLLCRSERLRGRPRTALKACTRALSADPDYGPALIDRGLAHLALGAFSRAVRDFDDGMRLHKPLPAALLGLSIAHVGLRQYPESDAAYRRALSLDPRARHAEITMGRLPSEETAYQAQIERLLPILERDAERPQTYLVKGNALHNAGYQDRAILEYTRAMELDGRLTAAYLARGAALTAQESLDAAEHDLRRAVELSPDDPETHAALVTLLTARRKYKDALSFAVAALRRQGDSPSPDLFVKAGNLRYFLKDVRQAEENYRLALRFGPAHAPAHNGLGLSRFARGDYKGAIESFSRAIALDPDYDRYHRNRASAYVNLKDFPNALADYRLALALNRDPDEAEEYKRLIAQTEAMIPARARGGASRPPARP